MRGVVGVLILGTCVLVLGTGCASLSPDRHWERLQARHPELYQLDNANWKTWLWHGALTYAGGRVIQATTPLSFRTGLRIVAAFYVAREIYNVSVEGNRKYGDATMDAATPLAVALLHVTVRVRW